VKAKTATRNYLNSQECKIITRATLLEDKKVASRLHPSKTPSISTKDLSLVASAPPKFLRHGSLVAGEVTQSKTRCLP
jgi:hypothetical protein